MTKKSAKNCLFYTKYHPTGSYKLSQKASHNNDKTIHGHLSYLLSKCDDFCHHLFSGTSCGGATVVFGGTHSHIFNETLTCESAGKGSMTFTSNLLRAHNVMYGRALFCWNNMPESSVSGQRTAAKTTLYSRKQGLSALRTLK